MLQLNKLGEYPEWSFVDTQNGWWTDTLPFNTEGLVNPQSGLLGLGADCKAD